MAKGRICGARISCLVGLTGAFSGMVASGQTAGVNTIGSTAYPNGGLSRTGSSIIDPNRGGLYAGAIDATQSTDYALYGNTGASATPTLFKVKLNTGGADPTLASSLVVNQTTYPLENHFQSIVIDTRSSDVTQHYAYVVNADGNKILKVQMFPSGSNLDAAPVVAAEYTATGLISGLGGAAIDLTNGYAYFAGSSTLDQLNLNTGAVLSMTGLPNVAYWRMGFANNAVYMMSNATSSGAIVRVKLGTNGSLTGATTDSIATSFGSDSAFEVDPSQPYAFIGTYKFGDTATPGRFMKFGTGSTMTSLGTVNLPNDAGTPALQERYLSTGVMDPDSRAIINGTDNSDPASVDKIAAGAGDALPTRLGSIQLPLAAVAGQGEDNMRSSVIDPKQGYAYFGTDSTPVRVIKVQYSQKGSIKGDKITLPANTSLNSVNFFASMPAPPTATSSGDIRLAIYGDNAGVPGSLIWQSADILDNVASGGGWLSVTSGLPTIATAGTYWLAWQCDSTLDIPSYATGVSGSGFNFNQAYGAFPSSMPTSLPAGYESGVTTTSDQWSMYVTFSSVPEPGSLMLMALGGMMLCGRRRSDAGAL